MKILVTGGAGFIGSAVVRRAVRAGHAVVNLAALTYAACLDNGAEVANDPAYHFEHADIRDRATLDRNFAEPTPDAIMHLDLVQVICAILDQKRPDGAPHARLITHVADRPGHNLRYAIDPSRIRDELGWRPWVTLKQGLERTVDWYLAHAPRWRALQDRQGVGTRLGVTS